MTSKKYIEELAEWANKKRNTRPRSIARVTFLAMKKDIKEAIENGYSMLLIWEHLRETGKLAVSYNTFTQYVNRYITKAKTPQPSLEKAKQEAAAKINTAAIEKKKATPVEKPVREKGTGFNFNPTPNPEELL